MPLPETFDAFVPSNFASLLTRANFHPSHIRLAELKELDDSLMPFKKSFELAEKLYTQTLLDHCLRTYYFALAVLNNGFPSNTPSVPQIACDELVRQVYLTCLLHDFGLSTHQDVISHPARDMTFEFHGGLIAYEHLRSEYSSILQLTDSQVADITQSIMLHTVPFETGASSAVGILVQMCSMFDMLGYGAFGPGSMENVFHRETVREIELAYPRGDLVQFSTQDVQGMLEAKPNCLMSHARPAFMERFMKGTHSLADSH
jgi:cyanamide hydratase family protein with HD domain